MSKIKLFLCVSTLVFSQTGYSVFVVRSTDFKEIVNSHRVSQARNMTWPGSFWAFSKTGIANPVNGGLSPSQKYDQFFNLGTQTYDWEKKYHNCERFKGTANEAACKGWYGHCNGWTAAAIMEAEPVERMVRKNPLGVDVTFEYWDQKAILTEIWNDVWASYEGVGSQVTIGDWIFDPNAPKGKEKNSFGVTHFDAYWDTSPRQFFLLLTNYLGILKVGLAIDRFTGSEIWNQPLAGYRILPFKGNTTEPIERGGSRIYPVSIQVKFFWANDSVPDTFKSDPRKPWNIESTTDSPSVDTDPTNSYHGRTVQFTLYFDAPVEMDSTGTKVIRAGNMVGDGVWAHANPAESSKWYPHGPEKSQLHPDFLWRPDHLVSPSYRNPVIDSEKFYSQVLQRPIPIAGAMPDPEPRPEPPVVVTPVTPPAPPVVVTPVTPPAPPVVVTPVTPPAPPVVVTPVTPPAPPVVVTPVTPQVPKFTSFTVKFDKHPDIELPRRDTKSERVLGKIFGTDFAGGFKFQAQGSRTMSVDFSLKTPRTLSEVKSLLEQNGFKGVQLNSR
jgi:hypothetical protein